MQNVLPVYPCNKISFDYDVDGDLTKSIWHQAEVVWLVDVVEDRDHQLVSVTRNSAKLYLTENSNDINFGFQKTAVACLWSDTSLYIAFRCEDSEITGTLNEHDSPLYEEEVVEVFISPNADPHTYFELEISPNNVMFDAVVESPDLHRGTMIVDTGWHCKGLVSAVRVDGEINNSAVKDDGWTVEMSIPFLALASNPPVNGSEWLVNFYRIDREPEEFTAWSPTLEVPANFHVPARFGILKFVS